MRLLTRRPVRARTQDVEIGEEAIIRTIAAAVFALLTVAAPAKAAGIIEESVNLNFGDGYQAIGDFGVLTNGFACCEFPTVEFDGSPVALSSTFTSEPGHLFYGNAGDPFLYDLAFSSPQPFLAPTTFADFSLNGTVAVAGDVSCISDNGSACPFPAVPLPAALPLFGSGLIALAGFAVRRKGKVAA
jgi:hypothetical protein